MALLKQVAPAQGATRVIDGDTTVVILDKSIMIPVLRRSLLVIDTAVGYCYFVEASQRTIWPTGSE
jgi:hypothetical protein